MCCVIMSRLESRPVTYVTVAVYTTKGCNPDKEEYTMSITSTMGSLDITPGGAPDDIELIREVIDDALNKYKLPEEGAGFFTLEESGEWDGMSWMKYFKVIRYAGVDA